MSRDVGADERAFGDDLETLSARRVQRAARERGADALARKLLRDLGAGLSHLKFFKLEQDLDEESIVPPCFLEFSAHGAL